MGAINTTAGPVDDGELGLTLIHEHMRVRSEAVAFQFPHLYDEDREYERAVTRVGEAMDYLDDKTLILGSETSKGRQGTLHRVRCSM